MPKKIIFLIVLALLLIVGLVLYSNHKERQASPSSIKSIQVGSKVLNNIEIADSSDERERGLSGKPSIEADYGMLFVFEKPGRFGFWMQDMNFPIDIIWLDKNFEITGLKSDALPDSYPMIFYPDPSAPLSSYVLETSPGLILEQNLKIGDRLIFSE